MLNTVEQPDDRLLNTRNQHYTNAQTDRNFKQ